MRIGIRGRLVVLLVVVALLPMLAALVAIIVWGRSVRVNSFGQMIQSVASAESRALEVTLYKDMEKLHITLEHDHTVISALLDSDQRMSAAELDRLCEQWPDLGINEGMMGRVLNSPAGRELRKFHEEDPRVVEILVTDRFGQLVAATGRTSDFYQGDESWWLRTYNDGESQILIPPVSYDRGSGVWSIDICLPLHRDGEFVGVGKLVLDISQWVGHLTREVGSIDASVVLVRQDGMILYRRDTEPLTQQMPDWSGPLALGGRVGWRLSPDGVIQGFAPVRVAGQVGPHPVTMPAWSVVLCVPEAEALGGIYRMALFVLAIGLGLILAVFVIGLLLAERCVVRRVRKLAGVARQVAGGNLTHRIKPDWAPKGILGSDELDELADDFDMMLNGVQQSHDRLREANELKASFIQVAGHELRSPVTYMLGLARLLRDCSDAERLRQGMGSISSKATRLSEIIRDIFKLMPDRRQRQYFVCSDVDLNEMVQEVRLHCIPFAEGRREQLVIEGSPDLPVIRADKPKLHDIVESLVMNAIKFTPDGGIVCISMSKVGQDSVSIAVADQGAGIAQDELPYIFDAFYSGGGVMHHSTGYEGYQKRGMGLGLTIVRHFAELHGGSVKVDTCQEGSVFTVTLPIGPPQEGPVN